MREFLFRAKSKEEDKWTYGSLQCFKGFSIFDEIWKNFIPVNRDTIGQYINIDDKNSKKIFEGDIVRFRGYYQEPHWIGTVTYDERNALYLFVGVMPYRYDSRHESDFEVQISSKDKSTFEILGNKWDNPELLGEEGYTNVLFERDGT